MNRIAGLTEETVVSKIYITRGMKVIFDSDLALLYGIETKALKRAVRRNPERFPEDFMFQLSREEYNFLRSQFGTLEKGRGGYSKYLPFVFTEQGVAMLSSILNSKRAIEVNVSIMRTFVKMRSLVYSNMELREKIKELEKITNERFKENDKKIKLIFDAIKSLIIKESKPKLKIGFHLPEKNK
ncbi:MAG TPA: ORF6N domain-containing protein [Ignavibacteria bacterium]|nr:ORF6N domain-containing protein [Ignavibacteria bacterium]